MRGAGSALFAGIMLMLIGTLDIIYGIAAISDSKFFVNDTTYVFSSLHTWGWITLILGVIPRCGFGEPLAVMPSPPAPRVVGVA